MKAIKEIIIMLLVCLAGILLFAVIFYDYIPSRKIVAEVVQYDSSEEVKELLADDIDSTDSSIITIFQEGNYEVTSSDLNNYEATDDYVPGKANPFAVVSEDTEEGDGNDSDSNSNTNTTNTTSNSNSTSTNSSNEEYMKNTVTK